MWPLILSKLYRMNGAMMLVCGLSSSAPNGPLPLLAADPYFFFVLKRKAKSLRRRGDGALV